MLVFLQNTLATFDKKMQVVNLVVTPLYHLLVQSLPVPQPIAEILL
jgi:hypothetical protein